MMNSLPESQLGCWFAAAREGDPHGLEQLLASYRAYLQVLAGAQLEPKLRVRVSPSDIVQETMLEAFRDFRGFRGGSLGEFLAWLRRILANNLASAINRHLKTAKRDMRREVRIEGKGDLGDSLNLSSNRLAGLAPGREDSPSASLKRAESLHHLAETLMSLNEDYRQVVTLRNLEGLSFQEVAEQMNRSEGATRMLWLRAIEKLKTQFAKRGWL